MKVALEELKMAINWIGENTRDEYVRIMEDRGKLYLKCFDPAEREVEITVCDVELRSFPTIKKTERLT